MLIHDGQPDGAQAEFADPDRYLLGRGVPIGTGTGAKPVTFDEPRLPDARDTRRCLRSRTYPRWGGSPNAGKIRSVSRKNVSRLSLPSHTSCTCSAQGR